LQRGALARKSPEPTLADHKATMAMLMEDAGDDPDAQREVTEWGERRERRLPALRRFAALLHRNGIIDDKMSRVHRNFMIVRCFALATKHGMDMLGYTWLDSESGPLSAPMKIDLHAVEPADGGDGSGLFPGEAEERAFLAEVAGKTDLELGRMARPVVIPEHRRIILLSEAVGYPHGTA